MNNTAENMETIIVEDVDPEVEETEEVIVKKRKSIDEQDFINVWNASDNVEEVVRVLFGNIEDEEYTKRRQYCCMRAANIRKQQKINGLEVLKMFPRGRQKGSKNKSKE